MSDQTETLSKWAQERFDSKPAVIPGGIEMHFASRLLERFNIPFTRESKRELLVLIKTKGIHLGSCMAREDALPCHKFVIPYAGDLVTVLLSKSGELVTIFKSSGFERHAAWEKKNGPTRKAISAVGAR